MEILVVEDDEAIAEMLACMLSNQNYVVEVANNGEAAWELIVVYEYDLLLMDITLPHLDGISLCRRVREHGYRMQIMLVTGRGSSQDQAIGLDAGAYAYITKPTDPEELTARIRALLRREGGLAKFFPTELILSRHCCLPKPSPDGIWQLRSGWRASLDRWRSRAAR